MSPPEPFEFCARRLGTAQHATTRVMRTRIVVRGITTVPRFLEDAPVKQDKGSGAAASSPGDTQGTVVSTTIGAAGARVDVRADCSRSPTAPRQSPTEACRCGPYPDPRF